MPGMPLSINTDTRYTLPSQSDQAGVNQNPVFVTSIGNGGDFDVTKILYSIGQMASTVGAMPNVVAGQSASFSPSGRVTTAGLGTPLGGFSFSVNNMLLFGGLFLVGILVWKRYRH